MSYTTQRLFTWLLVVGFILPVAGCSGGGKGASKKFKTYKVDGKATYLGAPLVGAVVTFSPQEKQPAAIGKTDDNGKFTLTTYAYGDGAAEGNYKVTVMLIMSEPAGKPQDAHSTDPSAVVGGAHAESGAKSSASLIPAKYGDAAETPLTAKVEPNNSNQVTLDIK